MLVAARANVARIRQLGTARDQSARTRVLEGFASELQALESGPEYDQLLAFLRRQLYLSPIDDVRESLVALFDELEIPSLPPEPTRWEPLDLPDIGSSDFAWLSKLCSSTGRLSHLDVLLTLQPELGKRLADSMEALMTSEGPLPVTWRHFIAIMGASRYSCEYLVAQQTELFLLHGGELSWLERPFNGLPKKLRVLSQINGKLAHAPWTLDPSDLEGLGVEGKWSASELAQMLAILATFHTLPCVVFALGVSPESDSGIGNWFISEPDWNQDEPLPACFSDPAKNSIIARLASRGSFTSTSSAISYQEACPSPAPPASFAAFDGFGVLSDKPGSGARSPLPGNSLSTARSSFMSGTEKEDLQSVMSAAPKWYSPISDCFRFGDHSSYEDIKVRDDRVLHSVNFSWEDHGMVILSQSLGSAAERISEEYAFALEFTNGKIGDIPVDTRPVRDALAKYVQRMFGVCHDDYPYDQLNKVLPLMHKVFLKKLACYPERIVKADYWRMRSAEGLTRQDIAHYAIIVFQTRRVIELTFATMALAKMLV